MSAKIFAEMLLQAPGIAEKICKVCRTSFPNSEYPPDKYIKGGVSLKCKGCTEDKARRKRATAMRFRRDNPQHTKEYQKQYKLDQKIIKNNPQVFEK